MFGMIAGQLLKKAVEHVQNKNRSNPDVNTADNHLQQKNFVMTFAMMCKRYK